VIYICKFRQNEPFWKNGPKILPTGHNGGSPKLRPSTMFAFERNRPLVGHAVYVFALPKAE